MTPMMRRQVIPMRATKRRLRGTCCDGPLPFTALALRPEDGPRFEPETGEELPRLQSLLPLQLQVGDDDTPPPAGDFDPLPVRRQHGPRRPDAGGGRDAVDLHDP